MHSENTIQHALFTFLLRIADDRLILGHRLSEWCGHGPILEEDIALGNIALDLLGQSSVLLQLAGEIENNNRTEDDLAYLREVVEFKNCKLVELPKGDFAFTIARQFLFSQYSLLLFQQLQKSSNEQLAGISAKAKKETLYHIRHAKQWMLRLGDGTEESHSRLQNAVNELWSYTLEIFFIDEGEKILFVENIIPSLDVLSSQWKEQVEECFREATIAIPQNGFQHSGGRIGKHTEHLGHLLSEMQILARSFPNAKW
jgi:ring-1,2-phenylacetyl-CoA epoxidase subunit PaaC